MGYDQVINTISHELRDTFMIARVTFSSISDPPRIDFPPKKTEDVMRIEC